MDRLLRADGQRRSQIVNNGPLLFLGILGTLAVSFWSLLLAPQLQLGGQQQVVLEANGQLYPAPRSGEAQQGAEVYRANGCVECHSRQVRQTGVAFEVWLAELGTNAAAVMTALKELNLQSANIAALPAKITGGLAVNEAQKIAGQLNAAGGTASAIITPLGPDIRRGWGPRLSVAQDYLFDSPVLLGSHRLGPDLASVGARLPDPNWHLRHFYAPRKVVPGSMMPPYAYLFEKRKLAQGETPRAGALPADTEPGYEVMPKPAARALTAYLLSLRTDAGLFEAPMPLPAGGGTNAPATNAPVVQAAAVPAK
jgi:cbb3-type cytochrome oxidase cytochrome c subunit